MRIGIDARFFRSSTAGIGRYTRGLLKELAHLDKKNEYIIYLTPADEPEYKIKAKNFQSKIVPITHYTLDEQTKFLKILNEDKLDLVHFLNFNHPIFYKGNFITTIHDLTIMYFPVGGSQTSFFKRLAFKKVMKSSAKNSQAIIAISEATKKDIVKEFKTKENKIKVIYEGIDDGYLTKKFLDSSKATKFKEKYNLRLPYLFFLSQWRPHKGLPELIKAFEIIHERYKLSCNLVLGGKSNPAFPEIPLAIKTSGYNKHIMCPGFIPEADLPYFYKYATAFIFPSQYEGFGLPPLEAMAQGVPVISSNKSCMPEILGKAAQYFNPNNAEEMAKVIKKVIQDKKLQSEMTKLGYKQIEKYSWRKMAKETFDLYKQILFNK